MTLKVVSARFQHSDFSGCEERRKALSKGSCKMLKVEQRILIRI